MTLRAFVLAACLALTLHAQSYEMLRGIQPGQQVRVTDSTGKSQSGTWRADSNDSVTFSTKKGEISVPHAQLRRVELKSSSRRARNIAIGAAVGVAIGATVDNTFGAFLRNESSGDGGRALTYALSIAAGAGLGALSGGWHTVYKSKSR